MRSDLPPIGLQLAVTAKAVSRAFNEALVEAGGSLPTWLVLHQLTESRWSTQQELARAVGIEGPTLTRHLDGLEEAGLVARTRHPDDRRAFQVELTERGRALHATLLTAVIAFNVTLRRGVDRQEIAQLRATLARLRANVTDSED